MSSEPEQTRTYHGIGLMSGSSLDGLDIALCSFEGSASAQNPFVLQNWALMAAQTAPFSEEWKRRLEALPQASALTFAKTHVDFGHYLGELVADFLPGKAKPDFIASHGHTVFHFPEQQFTTQIGDGASLAAKTGCTVISDFRSSDLAMGGQGAPLAPLADQWLLPRFDFYLNLGGIANISCNTGDRFVAFDISGANQILNALVKPTGWPYDKDGQLAAKGQLNEELLEQTNQLTFFKQPYPKSLGNDWVQEQQVKPYLQFDAPLEDKLHTACVQIGQQIATAVRQITERENMSKRHFQLLITGGGAFNHFLVQCIKKEVNRICPVAIETPDPSIISFKEACLIALMGVLRIEKQPNCLASVTGARQNAIGGAIYHGH